MFGDTTNSSNNTNSSNLTYGGGNTPRFELNSYADVKDSFNQGLRFDANNASESRILQLSELEGKITAKTALAQKESKATLAVANAASKMLGVIENHAIGRANIIKARNDANSRFIQQAEILNLDMGVTEAKHKGFSGVLDNVRQQFQW
jgi:hypothetical protein